MALTVETYLGRMTLGNCPARITRATIDLNYSASVEADAQQSRDRLAPLLDNLMLLAGRGFLGATDMVADVRVLPSGTGLRVVLAGENIPRGCVVIALRLLIRTHDSDPDELAGLIALIGEEDARAVYGGFDFRTGVDSVMLAFEGEGDGPPLDPVNIADGAIIGPERLTFQGMAHAEPDPATEDAILRLSGLGAFLPLGHPLTDRLGEEEWFVSGDDLLIDGLLIEQECLAALMAMLGDTGKQPPERS